MVVDDGRQTTDGRRRMIDGALDVSRSALDALGATFFGSRWPAISSRVKANRKELVRFVKFMVVGMIGTLVDFGTLNLLHLQLGLPVLVANTCSFTLAVISNFTWNRLWTYPESRSKPLGGQLAQFFAVNIAGWAINTGILWALLDLTTQWFGPLGYNIAKAVATGVVLFWNFFVNRFWTYNDVKLGS